jgi:hypothetical protein
VTQHRRAHPPAATVAGLAFMLGAAFLIAATTATARLIAACCRR